MNGINFNVVAPNVNYTRLSDESTDKQTEQVNFKGKLKITRKPKNNPIKIIDMLDEHAVDLINKNRPLAEKKEIAIRKSLEWIFKKLGFGKKLRNAGEEVKKQNKNINNINKIFHDYKLRRLAEKNPDEAREQIMRESLKDIGRFLKDV